MKWLSKLANPTHCKFLGCEFLDFITLIGRVFCNFLRAVGRWALFVCSAVYHIFTPPYYKKEILRQMIDIGYYSLPVVGLTTVFTGMVLALQSYSGFSRFSAESAVAMVVALSITRELGPVLVGLMVAGRIGASIAAEIGTMAVTEQIDALRTLSTNPFKYLVAPRVIAGVLMMLILVVIGDIIGIYGGFFISVYKLDFNSITYLKNTIEFLQPMDVITGVVKGGVFGFVITIMGCYNGFNARGGAQGVGNAVTTAVVSSSILILILNYVLSELFFTK